MNHTFYFIFKMVRVVAPLLEPRVGGESCTGGWRHAREHPPNMTARRFPPEIRLVLCPSANPTTSCGRLAAVVWVPRRDSLGSWAAAGPSWNRGAREVDGVHSSSWLSDVPRIARRFEGVHHGAYRTRRADCGCLVGCAALARRAPQTG